jgi:micrococcal nuclease
VDVVRDVLQRIRPRRAATLALLLPLAAAPAALRATWAVGAQAERSRRVELVAVLDGDGLRVRRGGRVESLRLACVDSEEALHASDSPARDKPQTVLGERARMWLAGRLAGTPGAVVELELTHHPGEGERDGFGRLLAHARAADGSDLGLELVRAGHSPYFVKYGACPLSDAAYRAAEREARAAGRGIWAADANRPAARDAPWARRDYAFLAAWWARRAEAVAGYRVLREREPLGVARADSADELARAAGGAARVFLEVVAARELDDGALELACAGGLLTVQIPSAARGHFASLELERRPWRGRANHLWLCAAPNQTDGAFRAQAAQPGALLEAGPKGPIVRR